MTPSQAGASPLLLYHDTDLGKAQHLRPVSRQIHRVSLKACLSASAPSSELLRAMTGFTSSMNTSQSSYWNQLYSACAAATLNLEFCRHSVHYKHSWYTSLHGALLSASSRQRTCPGLGIAGIKHLTLPSTA